MISTTPASHSSPVFPPTLSRPADAQCGTKHAEPSRYQETIRRLSENEKAVIKTELARIRPEDLDLFCSALQTGNWDAGIFKDEKYPYYALKALKKGRISEQQFGTVLFYWVNAKDTTLTPIPLFNPDGSHNDKAKRLIRETLAGTATAARNREAHLPDSNHSHLTEKQLNQLFEQMRNLPVSEQNFFLREKEVGETVMDAIFKEGINIFNLCEEGQMVPSLGLMQTLLNLKFGEDAVTLNPVLGLSEAKDIRKNGLTATRDLAIRFPGVALPDTADGHPAQGFAFTRHDFYHAFIASSVWDHHRQLFIQAADIANDIFKQLPKEEPSELANVLEDMEMTQYRHEVRNHRTPEEQTINHCFWSSFHIAYVKAKALKPTNDPASILPTKAEKEVFRKIAFQLPLDPEIAEGPSYDLEKMDNQLDADIERWNIALGRRKLHFLPPNDPRKILSDFKKIHPLRLMHEIWQIRISQYNSLFNTK